MYKYFQIIFHIFSFMKISSDFKTKYENSVGHRWLIGLWCHGNVACVPLCVMLMWCSTYISVCLRCNVHIIFELIYVYVWCCVLWNQSCINYHGISNSIWSIFTGLCAICLSVEITRWKETLELGKMIPIAWLHKCVQWTHIYFPYRRKFWRQFIERKRPCILNVNE